MMSATKMNDSLQPKTLGEAISVMAEPLGLDACTDKDEIRKFVNRYRNLLYNSYKQFKIFDSVFGCFTPCRIPLNCTNPCDECSDQFYWGFTLTKDMGGIVAAFQNGENLPLRSRWRETHTGIITKDYVEAQVVEISGRYPTERHLLTSSKLRFVAYNQEDDGKVVRLEVIDCDGRDRAIDFTLAFDSVVESDVVVREIKSVSLPNLCGHVTLMQECGYVLSEYAPDERVPNYKRVKIIQGCDQSKVLVQATRIFRDLYFDEDIVEVGDSLILEEAARYFRYYHSKDTEEVQLAQFAKSEMLKYLDNLLARDRGRHVQDNPKYGGMDCEYSCFPASLF